MVLLERCMAAKHHPPPNLPLEGGGFKARRARCGSGFSRDAARPEYQATMKEHRDFRRSHNGTRHSRQEQRSSHSMAVFHSTPSRAIALSRVSKTRRQVSRGALAALRSAATNLSLLEFAFRQENN